MNETMRERLKRRVRWTMAWGLAGLLLFILTPLSVQVHASLPLLGFGTFFLAMLSVQWLMKCPKCEARLGQEMAFRLGFSIFSKPPNFCPYCGVSLDELCP